MFACHLPQISIRAERLCNSDKLRTGLRVSMNASNDRYDPREHCLSGTQCRGHKKVTCQTSADETPTVKRGVDPRQWPLIPTAR
jgi:hypothetical protein